MVFYYSIALFLLFSRNSQYLLYWIVAIASISVLQYVTQTTLADGYVFSIYFVEFLAGAAAYHFHQSRTSFSPMQQLGMALLLFLAISFVMDRLPVDSFSWHLIAVFGFGCVGFLLILGMTGLERLSFFSASRTTIRTLHLVGDASYSLYLSHWFVLSAMGKIGALFSALPLAGVIVWHAVSIFAAIIFAIAVHLFLEKPLNQHLKRRFSQNHAKASR